MKKKFVLLTTALLSLGILSGCNGGNVTTGNPTTQSDPTTQGDSTTQKASPVFGEPTYTWADDNSKCTATRIDQNDPTNKEEETVDTKAEVTTEATCEEEGVKTFTATFTNPAFKTQTKEVIISATGHEYGDPTYEWLEGGKKCKAKVVCANDDSHVIEQTVDATSEVTLEPTEEADGTIVYTATFTDEHFTTQTKEGIVESLPTLDKLTFTKKEDNTYSVKSKDYNIKGRIKIPATYGEGTEEGAVSEVETRGFFNLAEIQEIFLPESIVSLGDDAFFNCKKLENVHFAPNSSLTTIGEYAFNSCEALTSVVLPKSVKNLKDCAFFNAKALESVTFEEGSQLESIGESCFYNCSSLTTLKFSEGTELKSIGYGLLYNAGKIEEVEIPSYNGRLATYTINNCGSLKTLTLPGNIATMEMYCVNNCPIENIYFKGTKEDWGKIEKDDGFFDDISTNTIHCTDGDVTF